MTKPITKAVHVFTTFSNSIFSFDLNELLMTTLPPFREAPSLWLKEVAESLTFLLRYHYHRARLARLRRKGRKRLLTDYEILETLDQRHDESDSNAPI